MECLIHLISTTMPSLNCYSSHHFDKSIKIDDHIDSSQSEFKEDAEHVMGHNQ